MNLEEPRTHAIIVAVAVPLIKLLFLKLKANRDAARREHGCGTLERAGRRLGRWWAASNRRT